MYNPESINILLCPDKFKGSLTAARATRAMQQAGNMAVESLKNSNYLSEKDVQRINFFCMPVSDGGEGFLEAFAAGSQIQRTNGFDYIEISAMNAIHEPIQEYYLSDGCTAVIESSRFTGLQQISDEIRNPMKASSYGLGLAMKDAILKGCQRLIIGLGGSATVDGGMGMLSALGFRFFDKDQNELDPSGASMMKIDSFSDAEYRKLIEFGNIEILIASDVTNPFYGETGAAFVYGPQKFSKSAANFPEDITRCIQDLDKGLRNVATVFSRKASNDCQNTDPFHAPGSGAAGGLGAALLLLNGEMKSGLSLILEGNSFDTMARQADLVLTGEGKLDKQTSAGKVVSGIGKRLQEINSQAVYIAFAGVLEADPEDLKQMNLHAAFRISDAAMNVEKAMAEGYDLLMQATFSAIRLFLIARFGKQS